MYSRTGTPSHRNAAHLSSFDGWVSVHSEYQGSHSWRDLKVQEVIDQTRQDLAYLGKVLAADGIAVPGGQKK